MAVNNSLTNKDRANIEKVNIKYESNGQTIKLTPAIVRNFLVSGEGEVSEQEIVMFMNLCRYQKLNPFLREAYLIKYGKGPATLVTGKDVFMKRAKRNKDYKGSQAGIIVRKKDGTTEQKIGTFYLDNEEVVGGWAKVFIEGFQEPVENTVSMGEYIGTKGDGTINSQWSKRPATMIRKVALTQTLREAFPEDFQSLYSQEEISDMDVKLDETPIQNPEESTESEKPIEVKAIQEEQQEDDPFAD